ncbi:MAG: sigma-54 dependent transcriptional regulator [Gemmatimonadota bacterium]|jgi:two-component system NtrC family response regulator/two-component system response regulator HydG|nr:sigma-54 dependent transcriptional regulator [Gemmatimonadota bacterium]MDP7030843.1 sigma-54 dependent transcriptional regulator [Gemmatimonadota bacterium]
MAGSTLLLAGPFPDWTDFAREAIAEGWNVTRVESGAEALRQLRDAPPDIALFPVELPDGPARNLITLGKREGLQTDFVLLAPENGSGRAELLAEGAEDVLDATTPHERLLARLDSLRQRRRLINDLELTVRDPAMLEIFERVLRAAPLKVTVLITGESGTGKEVLAQAIHRASDRADGPFVAVNVGALPANLLESELFGHEKGAFTSADGRRIGRFELADGGTLFLDEIGEMATEAQVNLLRVLEEERFLRVGGSKPVTVDTRIVAATNRDLEEEVRAGRFRRDLYYRLNVVHFHVPPLRERRGEIPALLRNFADRTAARHGLDFPGFTPEALDALETYEWPGNVRELRNLVDGMIALRPEKPVEAADLPPHVLHEAARQRHLPALPSDRTREEREFIIQSLLALRAEVAGIRELILAGATGRTPVPPGFTPPYGPAGGPVYPTGPVRVEEDRADEAGSLADMERHAVERALRESAGNRRRAARALGISERTLYRRIRDFGLTESGD